MTSYRSCQPDDTRTYVVVRIDWPSAEIRTLFLLTSKAINRNGDDKLAAVQELADDSLRPI